MSARCELTASLTPRLPAARTARLRISPPAPLRTLELVPRPVELLAVAVAVAGPVAAAAAEHRRLPALDAGEVGGALGRSEGVSFVLLLLVTAIRIPEVPLGAEVGI